MQDPTLAETLIGILLAPYAGPANSRQERQLPQPGPICYACNEGFCAYCDGWDRTTEDGFIRRRPCTHGCRPPQPQHGGLS